VKDRKRSGDSASSSSDTEEFPAAGPIVLSCKTEHGTILCKGESVSHPLPAIENCKAEAACKAEPVGEHLPALLNCKAETKKEEEVVVLDEEEEDEVITTHDSSEAAAMAWQARLDAYDRDEEDDSRVML